MKRTVIMKYFVCSVIIVLLLICISCAKPITSAKLVPDNIPKEHMVNGGPLCRSIFVENVDGGKETHPLLFPDIGNPALKEAIIESLQASNYLSADRDASDYGLTVFLVEIDCPPGGYSKTVTTFVRYKIIGKQSGGILYDEIIDAIDTKAWNDGSYGKDVLAPAGEVFGLALENSMRKNIQKFIKELSLLNHKL